MIVTSMKSEAVIRVTKMFTFDMAHALNGYDGPCRNIHGHTYSLFVSIKGKVKNDIEDPKNGMVMDFGFLKKIVKEEIISEFDHALVLEDSMAYSEGLRTQLKQQFDKVIYLPLQPTCENLMLHYLHLLMPHFTNHLELVYIKLSETPTSYTEWYASDN